MGKKNMNNDTIAGIATALSESGIGIIRVSGDDAIKIVNSIFVNKKGEHTLASFSSHTIHYGFIVFDGQEIDELMVSVMKAPNSFTKGDKLSRRCFCMQIRAGSSFIIRGKIMRAG